MIGHAGYLTNLPPKVLDTMIDVVKGVEHLSIGSTIVILCSMAIVAGTFKPRVRLVSERRISA